MGWFNWRRKRPAATLEAPDDAGTAMIGGRRRAVGVPYALPRDTEEINRLDFQHYVLRYALGGNYAAPLQNPASILDVGAGTGRWAMEMAALFPGAKVVGMDITAPPADDAASIGVDLRPANYAFQAGNILEGLPFADASFDFVHMRLLFSAMPADRWPFVVGELGRVTRPGGWVESVETTGVYSGGPAMDLMSAWLVEVCRRRGVDLTYGGRVGELMRSAGLANVSSRQVVLPVGAYGERLGTMVAADYFGVCAGLGGIVIGQGITTAEEFQRTLAQGRADVDSPSFRCTAPFYVALGQRR